MNIPVIEKSGHRYMDGGENESYAFRLYPKDLENLDPSALESHYEHLRETIAKTDGDFIKIYFKEGEIYANSHTENFSLPETETVPCPHLFDDLLGGGSSSLRVLNRGDHLKIRGKYFRFFRLKEFPHRISDQGHFNELGNFFMTMKKLSQDRGVLPAGQKEKGLSLGELRGLFRLQIRGGRESGGGFICPNPTRERKHSLKWSFGSGFSRTRKRS